MNRIIVYIFFLLSLGSCKKYFLDSGVHKGTFDGTLMQYFESKPIYFDTLVQIIKLAGYESTISNEQLTLFAPCDSSINRSLVALKNNVFERYGINITRLDQIKPSVWRKFLSRYIFKGKYKMNNYSQLDFANITAFDGKIYSCYEGSPMNVGVIYDDVNSVQYLGYRHLTISYIPDFSLQKLTSTWFTADVSSVDVQPKNGVVHIIRFTNHDFGFSVNEFIDEAVNAGLE